MTQVLNTLKPYRHPVSSDWVIAAVCRRGFYDKIPDFRRGVVWAPVAYWMFKSNIENHNRNENAGCHADDDRTWDLACGSDGLLRKQSIIQTPDGRCLVLIGDATVDTINVIANPDLSKSEREYTQGQTI